MQIRKILKQFGIKAHNLVEKRFENDNSDCEISIKLLIDSIPTPDPEDKWSEMIDLPEDVFNREKTND